MSDDAKVAARLLTHALMCEEVAATSWNEDIAIELEKLAGDCRKAAAEIIRSSPGPSGANVSTFSAPAISNRNAAGRVTVRALDKAVIDDWKANLSSRGDLARTSSAHGGEHEIVSGARRRNLQ
ncbi:MAG TPA: hypothetical protein VFB29_05225 [Pseudolabrys sp.]|nr:hypothetical protein [Pseudolabrys sp.]